jgi:hypothetical protein
MRVCGRWAAQGEQALVCGMEPGCVVLAGRHGRHACRLNCLAFMTVPLRLAACASSTSTELPGCLFTKIQMAFCCFMMGKGMAWAAVGTGE